MRHVFIVNPVSGRENCSNKIKNMISLASDADDCIILTTQYKGHATEIAQQLGKSGDVIRVYSCGGDGTLNEIIKGAYLYNNLQIACIPCGSGNDFIKNFGSYDEFTDILDYFNGTAIDIDLMKVNDEICLAIASIGLDCDVAYQIPKFRRFPLLKNGDMAYDLSIVYNLCKPLGKKLTIEHNDKTLKGDYLLAAICNGKAYGGGFYAAPDADLQDGKLKIVLIKKISRLKIAKVISLYKKGAHVNNGIVVESLKDDVEYFETTNITIKSDSKNTIVNIDGECHATNAFNFSVMPRCASFVLPQKVYSRYMALHKHLNDNVKV